MAPEPAVSLRPVTRETFSAVVRLSVAPEQAAFVASNAVSIAQTTVEPWARARAIHDGDRPVGFALFGRDPADGAWWVVRLMIDRALQRRGYGRAGLRRVLEEIARERAGEEVLVSLVPGNAAARALYEAEGFEATGRVVDGEDVLRLRS